MATFKMALDTRRAKIDGTFPIVFKITVKRKQVIISTGICVQQDSFCKRSGLVLNSPDLNDQLMRLENTYRKRFYDYVIHHNEAEDISELKQFILSKPTKEQTIYSFWEEVINQLMLANKFGSMKNYEQALRIISREINLNQPFKKLAYKDLVVLEGRLIQRGMSMNGMAVYLRAFRAVCNRAIKEDIVGYDWYPFRKYSVRRSKTTPRVISIEDMRKYYNLNYSPSHPRYKAWHIGKLLLLLRGINFKDLLLLRPENIKNGRIIYQRSKTGKIISIELNEEMEKSFAVFHPDQTLLGIITKEELKSPKPVELFRQKVKTINKQLRHIGVEIGVAEPLSTYVFRYTYANIAKQLGFSKDLIAEALSHQYGSSITGIYLEQFDLGLVDSMNQAIVNAVKGKN